MTAPADERGGVVVLMALGMVALTLMVAVVVDSASTRSIRRRARAAADASATAGVLDLTATSAVDACATAFAYAFTNLGVDQPSHGNIQGACSSATNGGMTAGAACTSGGPARVATVQVGDTTVQVTNPVPDTSPLLRATVVGGGYDQAADAGGGSIDGVDCQRLGVEITQPQSLIFGGVASSSNGRFSVHSVARYQPGLGKSNILPALIALEPTACKAVDAGSNGEIHVESTATGPESSTATRMGPAPPAAPARASSTQATRRPSMPTSCRQRCRASWPGTRPRAGAPPPAAPRTSTAQRRPTSGGGSLPGTPVWDEHGPTPPTTAG